MKKLKIKLIAKILLALSSFTLALAATKNSSFAMEYENIPAKATNFDIEQIKSQAHENAKNFLEWVKRKNIDLKTAKIVFIENGGNYDLEDDDYNYLNCLCKGQKVHLKVNLGLDQLKCYIANYLATLNDSKKDVLKEDSTTPSTKDPIKNLIIPMFINPATPTAENVSDKFYTILNPIPEHKIGENYNFGAKYYGTSRQMAALETFLEDISNEIGYQINNNVSLLYLMINSCDNRDGTGLEIYYHPYNTNNVNLAKKIYECCDILKNEKKFQPVKENTSKQVPVATQNMNITGNLCFVGFGDNKKDQKKILDPETLQKAAMEYAYATAQWLNRHPEFACITIEPTNNPYNFIVRAHIKDFKESKSNINKNKRMIVIGRADLNESQWNKTKNEENLVTLTETSKDREIMRTFNPLTDGAIEQINESDFKYDTRVDKLDGRNNKFYIRIYDGEGDRILSNITNFRLVEPNSAITNSFTKFDI